MAVPAAAAAKLLLKKKFLKKAIKWGTILALAIALIAFMIVVSLVSGLENPTPAGACDTEGFVAGGGTYIPDKSGKTNMSIAAIIYAVGKKRGVDDRTMLAAFETAIVESYGIRNLASNAVPESKKYPNDGTVPGDYDSVGVFQQRAGGSGRDGKKWGTVKQLMDPTHTANKFFDSAAVIKKTISPNATAGQFAQAVQISAFPDRYDQQKAQAEKIIAQVKAKASETKADAGNGGADKDAPTTTTEKPADDKKGDEKKPAAEDKKGDGGAGKWVYPVVGSQGISAGFGSYPGHTGTDYPVGVGTQVMAMSAGTVAAADFVTRPDGSPSYGNRVQIDHGGGITTLYAHLSEFKVKKGDKVAAGQLIGLSGNTGRSTGPHLHFEVRENNQAKDAMVYLKGKNATKLKKVGAVGGSGGGGSGGGGAGGDGTGGDTGGDVSCSAVDGSLTDPGVGPKNPSKGNLVPRAANLKDLVLSKWGCSESRKDPCVKTIYGVRADSLPDHPTGHAIDIMLTVDGSAAKGEAKALGDSMAKMIQSNAKNLGIKYLIWDDQIWSVARASEGWRDYKNVDNSANQKHQNHIHVTVQPGA